MSPRARKIIMSIRSVGNISGTELHGKFQDIVTLKILFHPDISPRHNVWTDLQKVLAKRQVFSIVHGRRRAIYNLADSIFSNPEENYLALEMAKLGLPAENVHRQSNPLSREEVTRQNKDAFNKEKFAQNAAMRLKDSDQKFFDELSKYCPDFFDEYNEISSEYGLSNAKQLRFLETFFPQMLIGSIWKKSNQQQNLLLRLSI